MSYYYDPNFNPTGFTHSGTYVDGYNPTPMFVPTPDGEYYISGEDSILYGNMVTPPPPPPPAPVAPPPAPVAPVADPTGGLLPAAEAWFTSPIPQYYPGTITPDLNQTQQQAYEEGLRAAEQSAARAAELERIYGSYLMQGPQMDPYIEDVVDAYAYEMNEQFAEQTIPTLQGQAVSSGQLGGSSQALAQAQAAEEMGETISQETARLMSTGYENAQDRYLMALTGAPGALTTTTGIGMMPSNLMMDYGTMQWSIQQQQAMEDYNEWLYYTQQPEHRLQTYSNLIYPYSTIGGTSGSQTDYEKDFEYQYL